jgi:alpha-tubulin suppressor-like RCC1 family protein
MRHRLTCAALFSLLALVLVSCQDVPTSSPDSPQFDIVDAVHNSGNPHFFFLPPMVPDPSAHFTDQPFDGSLEVEVEICIWNETAGACGPSLELYTKHWGRSDTVRVSASEEYYVVNWHTDGILNDPELQLADQGEVYRIRVMVDLRELGHADVKVVGSGKELKNMDTDEFIPLKDGRTLPIKFRVEEGAVSVARDLVGLGDNHSCAIASGGAAYCWGYNTYGQLGTGWYSPSELEPRPVTGGHAFQVVDGGDYHSCGLTTDGAAYCWGYNYYGQLGTGSAYYVEHTPKQVIGDDTFKAVTAGGGFSCALTTAGEAYCWGLNGYGQLGNGSVSPNELIPMEVTGEHTFEMLTSGWYHTCGLKANGEAYCWGRNYRGQLGNGTRTTIWPWAIPEPVEVNVEDGQTFTSLRAGQGHTCGITSDGETWCWGHNEWGQLGRGSFSDAEPSPWPINGDRGFVTLGVAHHTCAVTATGEAWCWGYNQWGQLGDGTTTTTDPYGKAAPVQVDNDEMFASVSAGWYHTCGVTMGGEAWCWGRNLYGQLGDGTFDIRPSPVLALDLDSPPVP